MQIHDNFSGSAHCIECKGECKLKGDERAVTELIRWYIERLASAGWTTVPPLERDALTKLGVKPDAFLSRALQQRIRA